MGLPGFTPPADMTVRQHRGHIYVRPLPARPIPSGAVVTPAVTGPDPRAHPAGRRPTGGTDATPRESRWGRAGTAICGPSRSATTVRPPPPTLRILCPAALSATATRGSGNSGHPGERSLTPPQARHGGAATAAEQRAEGWERWGHPSVTVRYPSRRSPRVTRRCCRAPSGARRAMPALTWHPHPHRLRTPPRRVEAVAAKGRWRPRGGGARLRTVHPHLAPHGGGRGWTVRGSR